MEYAIYKFDLDLNEAHSGVCVEVSRGDTHRRLSVGFHQGGATYPLPDGCRVVFFAQKEDGSLIFNHCDVLDDRVTVDLSTAVTAHEGLTECCLRIYGDGEDALLTSPSFDLSVYGGVAEDGGVEAAEEFTALTKAISDTFALAEATEEVRLATLEVKTEVESKLESGAFVGPKGDKGDRGETAYVLYDATVNCVPKTSSMTNPVGVDEGGQLWSEGVPDTYLTESDLGTKAAPLNDGGTVDVKYLPLIPNPSASVEIILSSSGWEGSEAPYYQTLSVEGITSLTNGLAAPSSAATVEERKAAREAVISLFAQGEGSLTFVADGELPTSDIPVSVVILG